MSGVTKPNPSEDSLDRIERLMAMEELLRNQIEADPDLNPGQREQLIREIEERIERAVLEDEDDFDDDDFAVLVRNLARAALKVRRARLWRHPRNHVSNNVGGVRNGRSRRNGNPELATGTVRGTVV